MLGLLSASTKIAVRKINASPPVMKARGERLYVGILADDEADDGWFGSVLTLYVRCM